MNDEAKARRTTKSTVLGKAKVMSYEDLEDARAKRAAKEQAATARKKKRDRRRKLKASMPDTLEAEPIPGDTLEFRAPVARMI